MSDLSKEHNWQPGGGETDEGTFRVCPTCGRVGNKMLCGPHVPSTLHSQGLDPIKEPILPWKTPLTSATVPHPNPEVQAAYRFGGIDGALELLNKMRHDDAIGELGSELRKWGKAEEAKEALQGPAGHMPKDEATETLAEIYGRHQMEGGGEDS